MSKAALTVRDGLDAAAALDEDVDVDLDNLDPKFIEILLDTLEHYKIFRLSIFVCNR